MAYGYMAVFGASVLVLLGFIYAATAGFMERQIDETINAEIRGLSEQYSQQGLSGLVRIIQARVARDKSGQSIYLLADWKFDPLAGNLAEWPSFADAGDGWADLSLENPETFEKRQTRLRHFLLPGNYRLLVGRDVSERDKVGRLIMDSLLWGLGITLVLGFFGGVLMSRFLLGRIDAINRTSREIMDGDLSRRVPLRGADDEFDRLAGNLNAMLDQIVALMDGVRQVSDNIAHDLRGPLNRIRAGLELTLREGGGIEDSRVAMERTIEEIDNLLGTFNALLTISQAEAGSRRQDFAPLDLAAVAGDVAELYEPLAEDKNLSLSVDLAGGQTVRGNRHLLSQALANLLDNAIKYTPSGGAVSLSLAAGPTGPVIEVADSGPGIPESARDKVLERFQRLESSRNTPGSGLGLSLAAAVVKLHHGELGLLDSPSGGLLVQVRLPSS